MPPPPRIEPGPGQESVWDYPRPPAIEPTDRRIRVVHAGITIADSTRSFRILETSQPPAYYVPRDDVAVEHLHRTRARTYCEWKGAATYWAVQVDDEVVPDAAWSYESPVTRYAAVTGYLAFYPQRLHECWVDTERVEPNPGSFYGGWITSHVVGPFKGGPATSSW